ncbi:MAG TPA: hypothetical protein VG797_02285 [Phycisphaerales bacterium]|nr:hypothetical protein [Phycisphaerales bacterium]
MIKALLVLIALPFLSGCVAWEIRDDLRMANFQVNDVKCDLEKVHGQLDGLKSTLDTTNEELAQVKSALGLTNSDLSTANAALGTVHERLRLLQSIDASMTKLDGHLASLRRTISKLDDVIPFFEFGDETPVETPPVTAVTTDGGETSSSPAAATETSAAAPTAAATPTDAGPAQTSKPKRNPLIGTWIRQFPKDQVDGLILLDETHAYYLTGGGSKIPATWAISGSTLTLTFEPQTVKKPDGTSETKTPVRVWTIIIQSPRTLTMESDRMVQVFAKP